MTKHKINLVLVLFVLSTTLILGSTIDAYAAPPASGDLEGCLNGNTGQGICDTAAEWGKSNISNDSLYTEGESIPIRVDMTGLNTDDTITQKLVVEWDLTRNSNGLKHTYDYITTFNLNDMPNPCFEISGSGCILNSSLDKSSSKIIPPPTKNTDVDIRPGSQPYGKQPFDSFNALQSGDKLFWMFAPTEKTVTITGIGYVSEGDPTTLSKTQLFVEFKTDSSHVVAAFGIHIASPNDWINTASSVQGVPYQVMCVSVNGGNCNAHINIDAGSIESLPAPQLTLKKTVINNSGGNTAATAWTLTATDGENNTPIDGTGEPAGENMATISNSVTEFVQYTLSESGPNGYTSTGIWSCTGDVDNFVGPDKITLSLEESATCEITNDDDTVIIVDPEADTEDGGDNAWDTRPTFGVSHETREDIIVENGFRFNGESFAVVDNHHTPFDEQIIELGAVNSFSATVYADKDLKVQEFLFGVPGIGMGHLAEMRVEVWFDYTGEIQDIIVKQESEIIDRASLIVTHQKSKCQTADIEEKCDTTFMSAVFLEPLKDKTMAIKAMDFKLRDQTTYLNDGFDISGDSLNPMNTMMIPSTVKYEGLVKVTQNEKYSKYWTTDDGRIFEMNSSDSFKQINQEFKRFQDSGEPLTRYHSEFASLIEFEAERALKVFDSTEIYRDCNFIQCY